MKTAVCTLRSIAPYSQSKYISIEKKEKEPDDEFEKRAWRDRMHITEEGLAFIPPMAFKNCLHTAAKYLRIRIPGKDRSEYTKHFLSGVIVPEPLVLPYKQSEVEGEWLYMDARGRKGASGGSRVWRCYPKFTEWGGNVSYLILDDTISRDVFERVIKESGNFIGIGRFRPEVGGYYGRFAVDKISWN